MVSKVIIIKYIYKFMDRKFVTFLEETLINHVQKITRFRDEIIIEVNVSDLKTILF